MAAEKEPIAIIGSCREAVGWEVQKGLEELIIKPIGIGWEAKLGKQGDKYLLKSMVVPVKDGIVTVIREVMTQDRKAVLLEHSGNARARYTLAAPNHQCSLTSISCVIDGKEKVLARKQRGEEADIEANKDSCEVMVEDLGDIINVLACGNCGETKLITARRNVPAAWVIEGMPAEEDPEIIIGKINQVAEAVLAVK